MYQTLEQQLTAEITEASALTTAFSLKDYRNAKAALVDVLVSNVLDLDSTTVGELTAAVERHAQSNSRLDTIDQNLLEKQLADLEIQSLTAEDFRIALTVFDSLPPTPAVQTEDRNAVRNALDARRIKLVQQSTAPVKQESINIEPRNFQLKKADWFQSDLGFLCFNRASTLLAKGVGFGTIGYIGYVYLTGNGESLTYASLATDLAAVAWGALWLRNRFKKPGRENIIQNNPLISDEKPLRLKSRI